MILKKSENQVKFMLADTILALCGSTIEYKSEVKVEGLLGISIDDQEVFLVQINKSMRKGTPGNPKKITSIVGRTRSTSKLAKGKKPTDKSPGKTPQKSASKTTKDDENDNADTTGKRKRKASWKMKLNMEDDHDYTGSEDKDDSGKKKKTGKYCRFVHF